jgi:hypothetical protein
MNLSSPGVTWNGANTSIREALDTAQKGKSRPTKALQSKFGSERSDVV